MNSNKIILLLGLFFAWLLTIPFNGPVLIKITETGEYQGFSLALYFGIANALGFLIYGIYRRQKQIDWLPMMFWGNIGCLLSCLVLLVLPTSFRWIVFVIMGFSASMFTIGWSYPFSQLAKKHNLISIMALTIILANGVLFINTQLLNYFHINIIYYFAIMPLVLIQFLITRIKGQGLEKDFPKVDKDVPLSVIVILATLIFALYIIGGFLYSVIYPSFFNYAVIDGFYRILPYLIPLVFLYRYGVRVNLTYLVYISSSFMGLAFVSFSLFYDKITGYFLTATFIQGGFALLDLFVFTMLGKLAYDYGNVHKIFGIGLAANVGAIICGELLAEKIIILSTSIYETTSLFAITIIFLTLMLVPWLEKIIDSQYSDTCHKDDLEPPINCESPLDLTVLTQRESEIAILIIEGYSNKVIAERLFISMNTLKTHIRNIYQKLGINHKRQLISKSLSKNKGIQLYQ